MLETMLETDIQRSESAAVAIEMRELPPYEYTLGATLIGAKEAVIAPLRPVLRKYSVTEAQWRVMRVINDRVAIDATRIAEVGSIRAPSVSRILRELNQRRLILCQPDDHDRRRTLIALSSAGKEIVRRTSHEMAGILESRARLFGADRMDRLIHELQALMVMLERG